MKLTLVKNINALIVLLVILITSNSFGQTVLLKQDVNADTTKVKWGPNYRNYLHFYVGLGFVLGKSESDSLKPLYGKSLESMIGMRYKLKLNNTFALGSDLAFNWTMFHIKQDSLKIFPGTPVKLHKREKLACRDIMLDAFLRINFGKRGNHIGNFVDLLGYGAFNYDPLYETLDTYKTANSVGASRTLQQHKGLTYINDISYGAGIRLGFNTTLLYVKYRVSDLFKNSLIYPELPRITAGLQISLHKA